MPTKLFYIQHNEASKQLHEKIYKEQFNSKPTDNNDLHNKLINAILEDGYEYRSTNGSLNSSQINKPKSGELLVEIETDDNNNIVQIRSQFGNTQASSLSDEAKPGVKKLLGLNANNNNNNENKINIKKSDKEPDNIITYKNVDRLVNINKRINISDLTFDISTTQNGEVISVKEGDRIHTSGTIFNEGVETLQYHLNQQDDLINEFEEIRTSNNQDDKPSDVFFSKPIDNSNNEDLFVYKTHYMGNSYSLTITSQGKKIYGIQDMDNQQIYKKTCPNKVPKAVHNVFEEHFKDKLENIAEALNKNSLWKENGKDISSVPKKLLRIINNDNYSPSEKYNLLVQEATHQQQQKRGKFGSFFKGGQRPAQVTSLLQSVANGEDIDIDNLTELVTGYNNNNENNNKDNKASTTVQYRKVLVDTRKNNDLMNKTGITNSML